MNVRTFFLAMCALSLVALAAPSFASAQTPERITNLDIHVWPEFDDPRVLVQLDGNLAAQNDYPRQIEFYIPAAAALTATAYQDEKQQFLNTDPATITDAGNGLKRVTFTVPKPNFHLEYYDDAIQGAPDKTLNFAYTALMPADSVQIQVQQPLKADEFKIEPAASLVSEGMHGFKYHIFNYPGVAAEQPLNLKVSYVKTDPNPSIQNVVPPETAPQANPTTDAAVSTDPQQLYLLIGGGIALALGLLAFYLWFTRRQPRLALAGASGGTSSGKKTDRGTGFCGQCGNTMRAGDNFCPKCGAKKR